jgi:hypothetical protein
MIWLLFTAVFAHLRMIQPPVQFTNSRGDENAPTGTCDRIQYSPDSPSVVLNQFKNGLRGSLREYFSDCGAKYCGNTNPSYVVTPASNTVAFSISARHDGMVEIWLDNERIVQSDQIQDQFTVDFSKCSGTCMLRFFMAALHNFPAELYENCVMVQINGNGNVNNPVPPNPTISVIQPTTSVNPVPTVIIPIPTQSSPVPTVPSTPSKPTKSKCNRKSQQIQKEWSCSSDFKSIIRQVHGSQYQFPCASGTKCTNVANLSYLVCQ